MESDYPVIYPGLKDIEYKNIEKESSSSEELIPEEILEAKPDQAESFHFIFYANAFFIL